MLYENTACTHMYILYQYICVHYILTNLHNSELKIYSMVTQLYWEPVREVTYK